MQNVCVYVLSDNSHDSHSSIHSGMEEVTRTDSNNECSQVGEEDNIYDDAMTGLPNISAYNAKKRVRTVMNRAIDNILIDNSSQSRSAFSAVSDVSAAAAAEAAEEEDIIIRDLDIPLGMSLEPAQVVDREEEDGDSASLLPPPPPLSCSSSHAYVRKKRSKYRLTDDERVESHNTASRNYYNRMKEKHLPLLNAWLEEHVNSAGCCKLCNQCLSDVKGGVLKMNGVYRTSSGKKITCRSLCGVWLKMPSKITESNFKSFLNVACDVICPSCAGAKDIASPVFYTSTTVIYNEAGERILTL